MLSPSLDAFSKSYNGKNSVLVWYELPADMISPVGALLSLKELSPYHLLFESVEGGETRARYSLIALDPDETWEWNADKTGNPFDSLRAFLNKSQVNVPAPLPSIAMGIYGYMSYDMVKYMEKLPNENPDTIGIPEAFYIRPKITCVFDAVKDTLYIATTAWFDEAVSATDAYNNATDRINTIIKQLQTPISPVTSPKSSLSDGAKVESHIDLDEYSEIIAKAKDYIKAGDIFQVVPSRRMHIEFGYSQLALYRALRSLNPSPYMFYVNIKDFTIIGASPETMVKKEKSTVTVRPIAGTRRRGKTEEEDIALEKELLADEKELAEHLMLLDLGRNDVGRVAKPDTVSVTAQMKVERYSHVMHIVSNVIGELDDDKDAVDALIAGFPAGTVSGAPKIRAMEIIDELEPEKRSFYSGTVGYFSSSGDMDTCIALRTGLVKDGKLYVQAGGGVVADSDANAEFEETANKARALIKAAGEAHRYEV